MAAKKPVKKAAKKAAKKVVKKAPAKKAAETPENVVTLAQLAEEAGIGAQRARQKLREAGVERSGRWTWEKGSKEAARILELIAPKIREAAPE